jgi:ABC-type transport system involved in cytochrome bd biosynthesis fused ATPase/permease subunit
MDPGLRYERGRRGIRLAARSMDSTCRSRRGAVLVRGGSGAGKTTLAHVLVRFLAYTGSYRIGGVEASELEPEPCAASWASSSSEPWLFDEERAPEPAVRPRHRDRR